MYSKNIPQSQFFLPHHCVFKIDISTTKLPVVFDSSVKSCNNLSLNDILLNEPVLLVDLFVILARFRFPTYAFSADLSKKCRQILISEPDKNLQLILWRNHSSETRIRVSHKWYLINYYKMSGCWSLLSLLTEKLKTLCSIVCHQTATEQQHQMEDIIWMIDLIRK